MPSSRVARNGPSRRAMPARTPDDDGLAGDGDWAMATRGVLRVGTGGNLTYVAPPHNAPAPSPPSGDAATRRRWAALEFPRGPCVKSARIPAPSAEGTP